MVRLLLSGGLLRLPCRKCLALLLLQVNVSLAVTMLVNEVPDLWFFVFNSSEYQSALGSINPSVTVTYTGSQ